MAQSGPEKPGRQLQLGPLAVVVQMPLPEQVWPFADSGHVTVQSAPVKPKRQTHLPVNLLHTPRF